MTMYYKVLRPVGPVDLKTLLSIVQILKIIPPDVYVAFEHFKTIDKNRADKEIRHACSNIILERILPYECLEMNSVEFWCTHLNESGHKMEWTP